MAQTARKSNAWSGTVKSPPLPPLSAAQLDSAPVASPARLLQDQLSLAYASALLPEPHVEKWPPAIRLVVLGGLTVGCWGGVLAVAHLMMSHLTAHG